MAVIKLKSFQKNIIPSQSYGSYCVANCRYQATASNISAFISKRSFKILIIYLLPEFSSESLETSYTFSLIDLETNLLKKIF